MGGAQDTSFSDHISYTGSSCPSHSPQLVLSSRWLFSGKENSFLPNSWDTGRCRSWRFLTLPTVSCPPSLPFQPCLSPSYNNPFKILLKRISPYSCSEGFFFFFFLSFYGHTHATWTFPGEGLNPSHSCDLCCNFDTLDPLTRCTGPGIHLAPLQLCSQILKLLHHSRNSTELIFSFKVVLRLTGGFLTSKNKKNKPSY